MPPNEDHSAEMIKLVEKRLPATLDKDEVIRWMGKSNPEIYVKSPCRHKTWRYIREDIQAVERWMGWEKADHAWARFDKEGGWPKQWPDRHKLAVLMVIMAEKTGEFRAPPTIVKALETISINVEDFALGDRKRTYHGYWPSAMLWTVDPKAMTLDQWIYRFKEELWTRNEKTNMMDPPPALRQKFGATSVHLVVHRRFPPASAALLVTPPARLVSQARKLPLSSAKMMMMTPVVQSKMTTTTPAVQPKLSKEAGQVEDKDTKPDIKLLSQTAVPMKRPATGIMLEQPETNIRVTDKEVDRVTRLKKKFRAARQEIRTHALQISQLHKMIKLQARMIEEVVDKVRAIEERNGDIVRSIEEDDEDTALSRLRRRRDGTRAIKIERF